MKKVFFKMKKGNRKLRKKRELDACINCLNTYRQFKVVNGFFHYLFRLCPYCGYEQW